jgi:large repetitive protein
MAIDRWGHTATLLPSGKVLIAGGRGGPNGPDTTAAAELYDPSTDAFTATGSMASRRIGHTATLLPNGKVLITGGEVEQGMDKPNEKSAELYDPATGAFSPTGAMSKPREGHTATLLANGKVLIAGGTTAYVTGHLASAELYDPATGAFIATGQMTTARTGHTATLLANGKVLLAGGAPDGMTMTESAELYDPATGSFSPTGSMAKPRWADTATLLRNGKVLIVGGTTFNTEYEYLASAELYDPATGVFSPTGSMSGPRIFHTATLMPSGKVLIAGGASDPDWSLETPALMYDPDAGSFAAIGSMATSRARHTATLLESGQVLLAGGDDSGGSRPSAEICTP